MINDPDGRPSFVDADRSVWDCNPHIQHPGRFYVASPTGDFEGMVGRMRSFISPGGWGGNRLAFLAEDALAPDTPVIRYTGPVQLPANALTFSTSEFESPPGGGTFGAMKWRIAEVAPWSRIQHSGEDVVLAPRSSSWRYFEGRQEPSDPGDAWRAVTYNDDPASTNWHGGVLPVGYGEAFIETRLSMQYEYTTLYLRKTFDVDDPEAFDSLTLEVRYDDGFNAWINGRYFAGDNVSGRELPFDATAQSSREDDSFVAFTHKAPGDFLSAGTNVIAIQLLNISKNNSNDCFVDAYLSARPKTGTGGGGQMGTYSISPGRYEIETVWESDEITDMAETSVRIPAAVIRPGRTYRVRCRMKDDAGRWSHWSDPQEFTAGEPVSAGVLEHLRITELMYHPAEPTDGSGFDKDDFEFIELKNTGDEELDLSALAFTEGVEFAFAAGRISTLAAGEFVLVVRNQAAFEERYGTGLSPRIAGQYYPQKLANEGEQITLLDEWNGTIAEFEYNDARGWPKSADGGGHSLVPLDRAVGDQPDGSLSYCGNWRASAFINGSPGADDPTPERTLVINEVMAHTDYNDPAHPEYDSNDWIELYNASSSDVSLRDWYLSDDVGDLKKWGLPDVITGAETLIAFDEVTGFHSPYPSGFGLNKAGEGVFLSFLPAGEPGRIADSLVFGGQENSLSLGRYPDGAEFFFRAEPTRARANALPRADVVISEIMYHPLDGQEEYIELLNPTSHTIDLFGGAGVWRLNGAVEFEIPRIAVAGGARLIVVDFDPALEVQRLDDFITTYQTGPLTPGVDIVGSWTGDLSNRTERVALEKPLSPDLPDTEVPWVIVDEVCYHDRTPWPANADGTGQSLQRISQAPAAASNDPSNWTSDIPSPGQ